MRNLTPQAAVNCHRSAIALSRSTASACWGLLACAALVCAGCYDSEALVGRVRNDALRHRLEEVDLGSYAITMPRDPDTAETVEVEMKLFGAIARYKMQKVKQQLAEDDYLLRHRTLMAIRESSPEDFTQPDLTALRTRLLAAANSVFDEPVIQRVGFYEIRFLRQ